MLEDELVEVTNPYLQELYEEIRQLRELIGKGYDGYIEANRIAAEREAKWALR